MISGPNKLSVRKNEEHGNGYDDDDDDADDDDDDSYLGSKQKIAKLGKSKEYSEEHDNGMMMPTMMKMMTMMMMMTCVPNNKYPSWAKAKKTVKNMTPNPATSPAHRARVLQMMIMIIMTLPFK